MIARVEQNALTRVFDQSRISPVLLHSRVLAERVVDDCDLRLIGRTVCQRSGEQCQGAGDEEKNYRKIVNHKRIAVHGFLLYGWRHEDSPGSEWGRLKLHPCEI